MYRYRYSSELREKDIDKYGSLTRRSKMLEAFADLYNKKKTELKGLADENF